MVFPHHFIGRYVLSCQEAGNNTDCHLQLLKQQLSALIGAVEPSCLEHGGYAARQCWGSVDECWCSDGTGRIERVEGRLGILVLSQKMVSSISIWNSRKIHDSSKIICQFAIIFHRNMKYISINHNFWWLWVSNSSSCCFAGKELEGTRASPGPSEQECAVMLGGSPDCARCTAGGPRDFWEELPEISMFSSWFTSFCWLHIFCTDSISGNHFMIPVRLDTSSRAWTACWAIASC